MRYFLIHLITALLVGGCCTTPVPAERSYTSLLDWTQANGVPGSVLLVQSPRSNFSGAVGNMHIDAPLRIGSVSKMFVGIVAAQMAAEGKLDLDAPITKWLDPSITDHITSGKRITLKQLLRHTSGTYDYEHNFSWQLRRYLFSPRGQYTTLEALSYAYGKPAQFEPDKGWQYSNTNYVLIGLILDRVAGHHHSIEVRRRIIEPLHLTHTCYDGFESPIGTRAHGYESLPWRRDVTDWSPPIAGPGAIVSTAQDVAVFVRAVVRNDDPFLSPATRKVLRDLPWPNPEPAPAYWPVTGYYCGISTASFHEGNTLIHFFGHDGALPGYFCFAYHEPQRDITIFYGGTSALFGRDYRLGPDNLFFNKLRGALIELAVRADGLDALATTRSTFKSPEMP